MENKLRVVELALLRMVPALVTFMLVTVSLFPERLFLPGQWIAHWTLITLYFCTLFRRGAFPLWLVFAIGLMQDALTGTPLGSSSFIYMLFFLMVTQRRRHLVQKNFRALWLWFALILLVTVLLQWALMSFYYMKTLPVGGAVSQWFVSVCFYPLMHIILGRWLLLVTAMQAKEHISRNYAHRSHH